MSAPGSTTTAPAGPGRIVTPLIEMGTAMPGRVMGELGGLAGPTHREPYVAATV